MREAELHPDVMPQVNVAGIEEMVAYKEYHSGAAVERVESYQARSYIPERQQKGRRHWEGKAAQQQAVYANRRRVQGSYGKSLLKKPGELVERSFAHCYDTGSMRRHLSAQTLEHPQAATDPRGGVQSESDLSPFAARRHAARMEKLGSKAVFVLVRVVYSRQASTSPVRKAKPRTTGASPRRVLAHGSPRECRKIATYTTGC